MIKTIGFAIVLAALAVAAGGGWLWWFAHTPLKLRADVVEFAVPAGSSARRAARAIVQAGVEMPAWAFEGLARIYPHIASDPADIKAGTYEIAIGTTPIALLEKLKRGELATADVQFIEGWTFRQMREALDTHSRIKHDTKGLADAEVLGRLGVPQAHGEGLFFPDRYRFPRDSSDLDILRAAYRAMEKRLDTAWRQRQSDLPFTTPYEALILASIVEKETGRPDERPLIAAVFVNRLRKGMRLQTDPAVIYGMGDRFDGNLRKRDLITDTPYNTYTRVGLPPTPIAMPGAASIAAVMNPPPTDAVYFVSRGDGTSEFSRSLDDHNRAVTKYQRGGRS